MWKDYIEFTLPLPISVNIAYVNSKNWRHKSKKYKEREDRAKISMYYVNNYKITWNERLEVKYDYYMNIFCKNWSKKKIDVFNYEKVLSDFLEKNIEGFEDKNIKRGTVEKHNSDKDIVNIYIKEVTI